MILRIASPRHETQVPPLIPATISDGFLLALESLMRRSGQGHHLAVTALELEAAPDPGLLRRTAAAIGHRYPLLHARMVRSPRRFEAAWHPGPPAPVPLHVHPPVESPDELARELLNGRSIDIHRPGPNLHLHAVPRVDGRFTLLLLWPHALLDAVGIEKLVASLDGEPGGELHGESSSVDGSPGQLWKEAQPVIHEMRTFPAWRVRSLRRRNPGRSCIEVLRFDRGQSATIRSTMAAAAGELLLLPYFAAVSARAVGAVIDRRHPDEQSAILLSLPVQRVSDPARRPLFQNHMTAWSLLLTPDELAELGPAAKALYRKYADFLRRRLPRSMEALMRLMQRCPSRLYLKPAAHYLRGEICSLFHSHTGRFARGLDEVLGRRLINGYHIPTVSSPPGIGIFFSEHDERLTCTLSWKENTLSGPELALLKQRLLADLGLEATPPDPSSPEAL